MIASFQSHYVPSEDGLPQNSTQPIMTEADVLITAALAARPARQRDLEAENEALHTLSQQLTGAPLGLLKTLVRLAKDLCRADTAGVSFLETLADGTSVFRWVAIAGALESLEQTTIPSNFSPCGTTINCGQPQLYARPELYFTYLHHPQFPIVESLVFPICVNDGQLGTIWIISHNEQRHFDREDQQLMNSLAGFAAAALQSINLRQRAELALQHEQAAKLEIETTRQAVDEAAGRAVDILESITDAFISLDGEWRITYVNQAVARINNLQPQEMIGKTHWEMWPWSVGTIVEQAYRQVIADQVAAHFEVFYEPLNMWLEIHAYPAAAGLNIYFRDISDRKQAENALRESEEFNRRVFESNIDCLKVLDLDGCLLSLNGLGRCLMEIEDCTPLLGTSWIEFWQDSDREKADNAVKTARTGGTGRFSGYCPTAKGTPKWWDVIVTPILDVWGKPKQLLVASRDISDRRQAEAALRDSEEKFRNMADNAPFMVWVTDPTGYCHYLSQSWYDFTGQTQETSLGLGWLNAVHPDDREFAEEAFLTANECQQVFRIEYRLRGKDGGYIWAIDVADPWRSADGEFKGYIGSVIDIDDRKQAEAALRESEERYRTLFESMDEGFAVLELLFDENDTPIDYRFLEVNPAFEQQTGLPQATGKTISQLVPNLEAHWVEIYGKIALTGESLRFENCAEAMNRWFDVYAFRIGQLEERKVAILFKDISDRKRIEIEREQAEKALQASEEQSRNILESISDGFFALDRDWRFTYMNPQAELILDRTPGDLLGKAIWEEYPGTVGIEFERAYRQTASERVASSFVSFYPDHNCWYEVHAYPAAEGITVYFRNVTDRKRVEEELRQKNAILEVINESAPTPIFVKDREGRIIYANPATLEVLGKSAAEVIGYRDLDLYPSSELAAIVMENDRRIIESGQTEVVEESPDGIRTFLGMKAPYRNEAGEVIGLIGISYDISDRKQIEADREQLLQREQAAREAAENANRIKDEFMAVLSHELRSPLNPILGWSNLLQKGKLDAAKTAQALAIIERNAKLQSELIEDLLDVSRILQGKLSLNITPVNLESTIISAIETVRLAAETKSIAVEVSLAPNLSSISGDATRLQQVVWNLLSNAVKFTPAGGSVEVRLAQVENQAQITIRDNGNGIASEFLPYIFDYFRQADSATTRQFSGLGLGLAIVRHIIELHGGTIEADSPGEGLGAAFTVQLPLMPMGLAENREQPFSQSSLNLDGVQILVVDDDTDSREFIVFLLEEAEASVISATSAREALAALTKSQLDIILSDIGMPDMDGYMLMRQVRALPPEQGGQIPAIALTAYAGDFNEKQALAAGFQRHVTKPVEPNELIKAIATLLKERS